MFIQSFLLLSFLLIIWAHPPPSLKPHRKASFNRPSGVGLSGGTLSLPCFAPFRDGTLLVPHGVPRSITQTTKPLQSLARSPRYGFNE